MSAATPAAPARRVPAAGHGAYARTGILVRSALRRDWVLIAVWVLGFVAIYAAQVSSARSLYADQADLDAAARTLAANPPSSP